LGATNVRVARVYENCIQHLEKEKIIIAEEPDELIYQIEKLIEKVNDENVETIGFGVPSVVNVEQGVVYDVQNIPSWKKIPIKTIFEKKFGKPVFVNNDANCFVLGEKYFGKGQGFDSIVGLTLGSGFGSGLILNGKLYCGENCGAGEVGMLPYKDSIFEHYCSGMFFDREYGISGKEFFQVVSKKESHAISMYRTFGEHLGNGIKAVLYAYDPQIIILGGSIAQAFPFFKDAMYKSMNDFAYPNSLGKLKIEISDLEDAAVLGAAVLATDRMSI